MITSGSGKNQSYDNLYISKIDTPCLGMCQNGGVCSQGTCICPNEYSGTYCQSAPGFGFGVGWIKIMSVIFWILVAVISVVGLFFCLYYFAKRRVVYTEHMQVNRPFN